MKAFLISTTTHKFKESASGLLLLAIERALRARGVKTFIVDASELHIVQNLSCYAGGGQNCAAKQAGKYRCWAHYNSVKDPEKFGGVDQMSVIYDGIEWADMVIFATSTRWMSHSALLQKIIERMNTLENRASVYGESNPLNEKTCGVVVTGQHYQSQNVASHLLDVFRTMGFDAGYDAAFVWQKTSDMMEEQDNQSNRPDVLEYLASSDGAIQISSFLEALGVD
jgi:multimeric flavodoxin WrbA